MDSSKKSVNVTVELVGVSAKATTGRVAAKGVSRIGIKRRGKYELEEIRGHEFNVSGQLMLKERVIDRTNDYYKELVVNVDTNEVVRNVEQPLSEHTGRGSAKFKK